MSGTSESTNVDGYEVLGCHERVGELAVNKRLYFDDLQMSKTDLKHQVDVDVPRCQVVVISDNVHFAVRTGQVLRALMTGVVSAPTSTEILSMCTQTSLALPLRALSRALKCDSIVAETRPASPLRMTVHLNARRVCTAKKLRVVCMSTLKTQHTLELRVEYAANEAYIHVVWKFL